MNQCCREIDLTDKPRVSYCDKCGSKINKEFIGESQNSYASKKAHAIEARIDKSRVYCRLNNYNGSGTEFLTYICFKPHHPSGNLQKDGGGYSYKKEVISLRNTRNDRRKKGDYSDIEFRQTFFNPKTDEFGDSTKIEFSDTEIFDISDISFNSLAIKKLIPPFYREISKEEYEAFKLKVSTVTELIKEFSKFDKDKQND